MKKLLQVHQVSGGYDRRHPIIKDIYFEVNPGEIVALIGLNGAGKSTTIKHILGLIQPVSGSITIHGYNAIDHPESYRSQFAFIPETPLFYQELTLREHLELTAMTRGLDQDLFTSRMHKLLQVFNMEDKLEHFPEHFSKGMRQKLMIMSALMVAPPLYIIDEPLMGLDPLGIRSLLQSLEQAKNEGSGVLMTTHILSTAERYCDRFIIMHQGRIVAHGTLDELREQSGVSDATLDEIYIQYVEGRVKP